MTKPRIAISLGDPCGIGPEITARALAEPVNATPIVHGSRDVWRRACELTGVDPGCATLVHCHDTRIDAVAAGIDSDEGGRAQAAYLESAAKSVLGSASVTPSRRIVRGPSNCTCRRALPRAGPD